MSAPFALQADDGRVDHAAVVKKRAIQCALSRICGSCGASLGWPVAFIGSDAEAEDGLFLYPPLHVGCAEDLLERFAPLGDGHLGRADAPEHWTLVRTGGFDLVRPTRRGRPVLFHPNSVVRSETEPPPAADAP